MNSLLKETYKAIVAVKKGEAPKIATLPLPKPGKDQILVNHLIEKSSIFVEAIKFHFFVSL